MFVTVLVLTQDTERTKSLVYDICSWLHAHEPDIRNGLGLRILDEKGQLIMPLSVLASVRKMVFARHPPGEPQRAEHALAEFREAMGTEIGSIAWWIALLPEDNFYTFNAPGATSPGRQNWPADPPLPSPTLPLFPPEKAAKDDPWSTEPDLPAVSSFPALPVVHPVPRPATPSPLAVPTAAAEPDPATARHLSGKRAAAFTLPDLAGNVVTSLAELHGKVVLVDFWATWCKPCQTELPELQKLHQQYAPQGVVVLGVSIDKVRGNALEMVDRLGLSFKVLHDADGKVVAAYDPLTMPTNYVIDRDGVVRFVNEGFRGAADIAKLRGQLEQLIKENAVATP